MAKIDKRFILLTPTETFALKASDIYYDQNTTIKDKLDIILKILMDNIRTVSSNTTLTTTDDIVLVNASSGNITISLPSSSTASGKFYIIKKIDSSSNIVTIDPYSSETIDGKSTYDLTVQYQFVNIYCDGTQWFIVGR